MTIDPDGIYILRHRRYAGWWSSGTFDSPLTSEVVFSAVVVPGSVLLATDKDWRSDWTAEVCPFRGDPTVAELVGVGDRMQDPFPTLNPVEVQR